MPDGGEPAASPAAVPFDVAGARAAGYSDGEIASYVGGLTNFNVDAARKAGYHDDEIIGHLAVQPKVPEPPAPPSSTLGGIGKALAQTPTDFAGGLVKAGGEMVTSVGTAAQSAASNAEAFTRQQTGIINRIDAGQTVPAADDPLGYGDASAAQKTDIRQSLEHDIAALPAPQDTGLGQAGQAVKTAGGAVAGFGQGITDYGEAAFPLSPEDQQRLSVRAVKMVASFAPYMMAALGGPEAVAALAGVQGFGADYDAAKQAKATDEQAATAALFGGVSNAALMMVPIHKAMDVAATLPNMLMKGQFLKAVGDMAKSSATLVTFSQLQTVADNVIAQQTYAPDRPLTQNVGKDIALQAAVGAFLPVAGMGVGAGARLAGRAFRPNVQPRPAVADVLAAPDLNTAIDAAQQVASGTGDAGTPPPPPPATPGTPVDVAAETAQLATGDSADLQQAALLKLFHNTGAGTVEATPDGGYQFRTTNAAGSEITHPIDVWQPSAAQPGDASTISADTADALRAHYGQAGVDVVFYKDDARAVPFEGAHDPNQPDTIFLSSNPTRNVAQVAGHEFTHVLQTTTLPDGSSLNDLLNQQIAAGITPAGQRYAQATFGSTAPGRAAFPDDASHAAAVQAHLINELGTDIGGEAPKFQSFLPRVVDAIQARFGDSVAGDVLGKLIDGLKSAMETVRGLFADTGTRSQNWVTNIGEVHDTLAQMYAARFGTPVEREQAGLTAMRDKAERDRFVAPAPDALAQGATVISPHGNAVVVGGTIMDQGTPGHLIQMPDGAQHFVHDERLHPIAAPTARDQVVTPAEPGTAATGPDYGAIRDATTAKALQLRRWLDGLATDRDAAAAATPQARLLAQTEAAIVRPVGGDETQLPDATKARLDAVRTKLDEVTHPTADTPAMAKVRDEMGATAADVATTASAPAEAAPARPSRTGADRPSYWMNEGEVDEAIDRHRSDPLLGPVTRWLGAYRDAVNEKSDGWAHWGASVAKPLMGLIHQGEARNRNYWDKKGGTVAPTEAEIRAAISPIKAFATKHGLNIPESPLAPATPAPRPARVRAPAAPPIEHPGLIVTSLENGETTHVQPPGTVPPGTRPSALPADFGANNTTFTKDMADKARERLRAKMNRLNAGFDPETALDGLMLAGYYVEGGIRKFVDFSKRMVDDLGEGVRPSLAQFYTAVRMHPGFDTTGMDGHAEVEAAHARQMEAAANERGTGRPDSGVGEPGSGEAGSGGGRDGLAAGGGPDRPLEGVPPGDGAGLAGTGAGDAGEAGVRPGTEGVPGTGDVHPGGDADTGRPGGSHEGLADDGTGNGNGREPTPAPARPNFHVDDPETLIGGTPKVRFARNRAALEALAEIEAEQRAPSHEELQAMAGYIGWGSFGQDLFKGTFERQPAREGWDKEAAWLRQHLGKEQWESAQRSIINAHFTDPPTVKAMWDMVRAMGFKGGRVLEPSMGIGNFFGLMPRDLMAASSLTGIELDNVTGRMAKLLYPDAGIHIKGYQDSHTPDNFYDLTIGNWPFAAEGPADRRYDRMAPTLHDYFFLKALDQTRPGGLVVGITSAGTMDKAGRATRLELARKGELLASFRLPSGAFEKYAGTSVVTDIIVLRKRAVPAENPSLEPWINSAAMDTPAGEGMSKAEKALRTIRVNQHYQDNPDAVLGQLDFGHGTTQGKPGMIVHRPDDLMQRLERLPSLVPTDGYDPAIRGNEPRFLANNTTDRNGSIIVRPDGRLYQVAGDQMLDMADTLPKLLTGTAKEQRARVNQMRGMVDLRRGYGALIDAERDGKPETESLRQTLAKQYNDFRALYGQIRDSAALKLMHLAKDPGYAMVRALERPDGTPSRILSESTVRSKRSLDNPSIADAYILARNEQSILDVDRVAELAKVTREVAIQHLLETDAVLRTPGGGYEPADQYLSGNVRKKLAEAQQALAQGEPMQHTVDRLTAAIPETVPYFAIEAKLGAPWVGDAAYKAFIGELLGLKPGDTSGIGVQFVGNRWKVTLDNNLRSKPEADLWGHNRFYFDNFIGKAMGNETLRVMDPADGDGGPYFNAAASEEANAKAQALREKFTDWAWADPERKVAFEQAYNQTMNAIARPQFDGSFMDMSGMALRRGEDAFSLRRHQVNAIWRGVIQGRGLFAHEVGTGKTYTMGGIAVEGRRYGVFRKPLLFAHNANSATVAREINEMYPGARIHYVDNLAPENIATEMHRIANEDWDLVVMPHSLIDRMSLTKPTLMELAAEDIANLENEAIEAAASDGYHLTPEMMGDKKAMGAVRSPTAKELVKARQAILTRIEKDANRSSREGAIPFEQLGVDAIMVDEAHIFKKPPYVATRMRVKGLNTATSNRSIGLGFLTSYVKRANAGRNVYLFTGTPITNSLNEIFNQSRYFMDDRLEQAGVKQWDAWFNTFAAAEPDVELTAGGQFENVTRLASFVNTDELVRMMSEFTDVVQAKDMPEFVDRATPDGKTLKSPDLTPEQKDFLTNGRTPNPPGRPYKRIITDVAEMSPAQRDVLTDVQERIAAFKAMSGKDRWEAMMSGARESPIITDQDGPKASLDVRNYDPDAPDDPNSKVNRAVRNMLRIYQEPGAAQMVFMETGYNAGVSQAGRAHKFILVKDMVDKLVAGGIPRDEIAVVAGGVTPEQKKAIADKMNDGRLRVAIGQTETLGTGVNAQRQLRAIHHLDAPWRPGDLEQRNGRGERQGNEWNTMQEYRYITEGIDGRRWQVLTSKDGFIKKFINAFNDTSGKRLGSMEVDADALDDKEDMTQTLSAAAGDPRIMLRAKYKGDVTRLERRERLHTVGQADALGQVRRSEGEQRRSLAEAQAYTDWGDTWNAGSQRAAAEAHAAGDTRRWYEVQGSPQEAATALDARAADARAQVAQVEELLRVAQTKTADDPQGAANLTRRIADLSKKLEGFTAQAGHADAAARAGRETGVWHEGGDAIQARIDAQVKGLERAPIGTSHANVPEHTLATVNGFPIKAKWYPGNSEPLYWIADPTGEHRIAEISAPTMPRIIPRMNQMHDAAAASQFRADEAGKSIEALRKSATMDFPQREALQNKRMQLAKLEDDLQANPTPPPAWLRHGAPMDSTIYVNGQPREVRGHHMSDDYYLGTDQGDVRYLDAKDENGQPMFDVHPAPPKMQPREVPEWIKPHAEALGGQVYWHDGDLAVVRARQDGETAFLGFKEGIAPEHQGFNIFGIGGRGTSGNEESAMRAGVKEIEDRERNRAAMTAAGHAASPALAEADDYYRGDDSAGPVQFSPREREEGRTPLFSALTRAVEGIKQEKATPGQWIATIKNMAGVKPEERAWTGLDDWLGKQPKSVTKAEVLDYLRANELDVREVVRGKPLPLTAAETAEAAALKQRFADRDMTLNYNDAGRLSELENQRDLPALTGATPKFGSYTLPGSENYREMLMTLPPKADKGWDVFDPANGRSVAHFDTEAEARDNADMRGDNFDYGPTAASDNPAIYRSSHWDEPNVVAHTRFSERTAPDGARVLHIEEVQSDWHQTGRKQGYDTGAPADRFHIVDQRGNQRGDWATRAEAEAYTHDVTLGRGAQVATHPGTPTGVPDAPFKTTWPMLAMKRMTQYAVDHGFDRVAWTPGDVQADRYSLAKRIASVAYGVDGRMKGTLQALDHSGRMVANPMLENDAQLADHVGKETADRLLTQPTKTMENNGTKWHVLSGLDLKVGGEGMKGFYDKQLPTEVQKLVGKFGAKVGRSEVSLAKEYSDTPPIRQSVHSFDITPQLREAVQTQGLPLFSPHPVADLKSDQIAAPGTPGRLQRIREWAYLHLRGQTVRSNALGANVTVNRAGINKTLNRAGDDILSAIPAIPDLIARGERIGQPEPPRNAEEARSTLAWHLLGGAVTIDGRQVPMVLHIQEDRAGHFFYNLNRDRSGDANLQKAGSAASEETARASMGRATPDADIARPAGNSDDPQFSPRQRVAVRNERETERWTPSEVAAYSHVGRVVVAPTWRDRLSAMTSDLGRRTVRYWLDPYIGVKADDPAGYMALRNANTTAGATEMFLTDGTLKFNGSTYAMDSRNGGVEHYLIRPLHGEQDRFIWWVAANRAERLSAEDRENLWSQDDIDTIKQTNQGQVPFDYQLQNGQMTRSREAIYLDSLRKLDVFNKNSLDLAVQSGLLDADKVSALFSNPFYVPFYRVAEDDGHFAGPNLTSGFVKQNAFKTLKGGTQALRNDLWDNAIKNWAHMIDASLRNRAASGVLDTALTNGAVTERSERERAYMTKAEQRKLVWVMNNGQRQSFQVHDPLLFSAISALDFSGFHNPVMKAMTAFKTLLTQGVTADPRFMLRVSIRDAEQAIATAPMSFNIAKNVATGFKMGDLPGALQNVARAVAGQQLHRLSLSGEAADVIAGGGTMRLGSGHDTGGRTTDLDTMLDRPASINAFWHRLSQIARAYKEVTAQAEDTQRFALYHRLIGEGVPHDQASFAARDLEDFTLKGAGPIVRVLTQTVPFMNAWAQGLYKVGRAAADQDRNMAVAVGARLAASTTKRVAIVLGATTLLTLALDQIYADDEDYKKRPDYDRDANFWFKFGGVQFRIPMGFEIAAMSRIATNGVEAMFGLNEMTPRRFANTVGQILGTNMAMSPVPQIVRPALDLLENQTGTGSPIVNEGMNRLRSEEQYTSSTTLLARAASSAGNAAARAIAGPQAQFLAPVQLDYLVNGYFGWAGSHVLNLADMLARGADQGQAALRGAAPLEPVRPNVDLLGQVTGGMVSTETTPQSRYVDMLYQQADGVNRANATYHDLIARGRVADAGAFFAANKDQISRHGLVEKVQQVETTANQQIKRIGESRTLSAEQKRLDIAKYNAMRNRAAENVFGARP